ncbi:MAG TPA: tetratricopeptide repeat protein [Verrucomicrobiae bacterium]|nr:tetratricopeptide repeat protein [Verrucomicrobiae bacterium]
MRETLRRGLVCGCLWLLLAARGFCAPLVENEIVGKPWFEARTAHFRIFSCGPTQQVAKVGARLEQFRQAYATLAGAQAVESPPIVVIAFPDRRSMVPFLPVYKGQPANLAAFFHRDSDENFIALSLAGAGAEALEPIFHEYAHLLFRHNQLIWPMWLNEGMADVYSTFEADPYGVIIGKPMPTYLELLRNRQWMPLAELFKVTVKSPAYNERDRQGIFYAESWLLTHYLMLGDNALMKSRFRELTAHLKKGETPEQAFTNAMGVTAQQMENQLHAYLKRGRFQPLRLSIPSGLGSARAMSFRGLAPVEVRFRIGDMMMRINRTGEAKAFFDDANRIAPKSPLPVEGLGLLAADQNDASEAVRMLETSINRGSMSFLTHYVYAQEKYFLTQKKTDVFTKIDSAAEAEIESELLKAMRLMPDFAPAQELMGFLLMVQGHRLDEAEQHLRRAIQLEPENQGYLFTLAQVQMHRQNFAEARKTLEPLRVAASDPDLKKHAEELLRRIDKDQPSR